MNSLYDLDPKWQRLLNLNNFLGGLTVNEFVEELSNDHSLRIERPFSDENVVSTNTWQNLDSKPYIRTFESTLKQLKHLNEESINKKSQLSNQVAIQELEHSESVLKLSKDLNTMISQFNVLDEQLTNVNQVVSPLGDKLESAIKRKKNYIKSVELISQYNEFLINGQSKYIDDLRTSNIWSNNLKAVNLTKNLLILSTKLETNLIPKTLEISSSIQKYSEMLELDLLDQFNKAYQNNNFNQLNEIALILDHYNNGVNVIQSFINQHSYFIDSNQVELDERSNNLIFTDEDFKANMNNPLSHTFKFEESFIAILNDIELVIKNESKIVKKVFEERSSYVIQLFIQRIFVQKIELKVDSYLNNALALTNLAYVRTLHGLYQLIGKFVRNLADFFQALEENNSSKNNILITTLEQCFSDLFSKYLYDRSSYFDIEKRNLETTLIDLTSRFIIKHNNELKPKLLSNKFNQNVEKYINDDFNFIKKGYKSSGNVSNVTASSRKRLLRFNTYLKNQLDNLDHAVNRSNSVLINNEHSNSNEFDTSISYNNKTDADDEQDFNINNVDEMLKCVIESIARVMEIIPKNAFDYSLELLEVMIMGIINNYIEVALEVAYYRAKSNHHSNTIANDNDVLSLSFLKYITKSTEMLGLVSTSIKSIFMPLLNNSPNVKLALIELTNNSIKKSEILINIILNETTSIYSNKFALSLSKQKKKDFTPKSQDQLDQDTLPAIEIVNCLNSLYSQCKHNLKNGNLETFLNSVGEDLFNLLLNHYSKFQVSSIGGIIVTKDIIGIQNVIETWGFENLMEKFATLRELANLYTVQPDLLDSLTKEGRLADFNRDIIRNYISNREDFNHENFISSMKKRF
ncbi:hypothetical protein KAFR_0H02010 [Kazachstania africana CBS 2517]|uniref:Uncharacterized protein n=1 Tax=Kazachstania africana (strain ATCC 22294 / BCRC 22015 / CBS 2517 / CECT 1963 / NBRC 1671 / NRRL Y-8276) TaxID=1071382 RepID=H2AZ54_KAZAF|nr:hypothetical protein KAFR_0H02010 [Kazachstania africana CBS 2517]CCF59610.1 hypothetical protein KAFR_0H02010 [Kazachstania africana CBS 2517]